MTFELSWLDWAIASYPSSAPVWVWVGVGVCTCLLAWRVQYEWTYGVWKRMGVSGPTPLPIFGTNHLLVSSNNGHQMEMDMCAKYGQKGYYGMYEGSTPVLTITDPDLIQDVMIKRFEAFGNRRSKGTLNIKNLSRSLTFLPYEQWRLIRLTLSPAFTAAKLKRLMLVINDVGEHFSRKLAVLTEKGGGEAEVELKPLFDAFAMDNILNFLFGITADTQADPDNVVAAMFFEMARDNKEFLKPIVILALLFPNWTGWLNKIDPNLGFNLKPIHYAREKIRAMLQNPVSEEKKADYTYFLASLAQMIQLHSQTHGQEGFDFETAAQNALNLQVAGFDTTSNLMMWVTYYLALYPHLQQELREEIESECGLHNKQLSFEQMSALKKTENFLMESLRLRPVRRTQREARMDVTLENGITIKKGWCVDVPVLATHMDPRLWHEPEEFRPCRFDSPNISSVAFNGFGVGPRSCIGRRFSLLEGKRALVALLSDYEVQMGPDTPRVITHYAKSIFHDPSEPIKLRIVRRKISVDN